MVTIVNDLLWQVATVALSVFKATVLVIEILAVALPCYCNAVIADTH
jgi:hypothetical protein